MESKELKELINRDITTRYENGSFSIEIEPGDWLSSFTSTDDAVRLIQKRMSEKYLNGLVGFIPDSFYKSGCVYKSVFTPEIQKEFNKEQEDYIREKSEWCNKYGCD